MEHSFSKYYNRAKSNLDFELSACNQNPLEVRQEQDEMVIEAFGGK